MASFNRVIMMGNLTRDPEVRYTPSGKAVGELGLAMSHSYKTANNEQRDEVCYVNVVVWGRQAETCGEYLSKGSSVFVEGRLQYDQWEKDGQKFNRLRVVASRVQFLGSPKRSAEVREDSAEVREDSGEVREDSGEVSDGGAAPTESSSTPVPPSDMGDDDNLPF